MKKFLNQSAASLLLAALSFLLFTSSDQLTAAAPKAPAAPPAVDGTAVVGVVKFPKDYPEREKIMITKDQAICRAFQYSESFVVSEANHGLKNVIVSIKGLKGKTSPGNAAVTLDQKRCQYVPHVQAVPAGSKLQIINEDGILHNVHVYAGSTDPKNTIFNKAQPKFLKKISQPLDKPGIYFYKCDVHAHMTAFIAVMDHPYYAVTDDNGEFSIANVPPGKYTVTAWHEVLGTMQKEVVVKKGKPAKVVFDILPNE